MQPRQRLIGVIGAAACDAAVAARAYEVGRRLAEAGCAVVCGGLGGVMAAASRGAAEAGGLVIGLLPGDDPHAANPYVTVAIPTGLGEARNAVIALASEALIAIAGGWGTLSEIALARKRGKPVVSLDSWRPDDSVLCATSPRHAVELALATVR
ncbi:MAG: TIGR00725 family protein [Planctomycetota bacterium]|nr:MAG: TIGR00725 family protein [Planctomycetota bacterium]